MPRLDASKLEIEQAFLDSGAIADQLPDPEDLAKYEEIYPGSAERILRAWEAENENRRAFMEDYYRRESRAMRWWRLASFATLILGQAVFVYLVFQGDYLLGFGLAALVTFGHLAGAFIQGMLLPDAGKRAMRERK